MTRRARAYQLLFAANFVAVVVIWWIGLDRRELATLPGTLNAAGRITGLVGTYLVLVQLILRTHVPWLVAAFGKDALKGWHTWNAYAAAVLIGEHVLFQFAGYALEDRVDAVTEIGLLLTKYEGMVFAVMGAALLAGLTLLALDGVRHRIPWPTWRALHLYTYAAIALAVPHMIATGSDFIDAPIAVVYWSALEIAFAAIVVGARVPPVWRAATATGRPHPAIVSVGVLIIAGYLLSSVRLTPAQTVAAASPRSGLVPSAPSMAPSPTAAPTFGSGGSLVVQGDEVETPYGRLQLRVVFTDGHITDIESLEMPAATKRSQTISTSVEPWLRKRAIAAQSADFDVLSGATYTSFAYQRSLLTALKAIGAD